jgi:hypothetical protein
VHWIIGNPTYTGRIRWRDKLFDGVHEPLVDELTFQRAQAILRERGEDISRRRGNASDFLLSGVVRCGRCGKAYVGTIGAEIARGEQALERYHEAFEQASSPPNAVTSDSRGSRRASKTSALSKPNSPRRRDLGRHRRGAHLARPRRREGERP